MRKVGSIAYLFTSLIHTNFRTHLKIFLREKPDILKTIGLRLLVINGFFRLYLVMKLNWIIIDQNKFRSLNH